MDPEARRIATEAKLATKMVEADKRRTDCKYNI